jgi:Sulfotransferase family
LVDGLSRRTPAPARDTVGRVGGRPPQKPILVTGAIRSGTGWVGQVLAASPDPVGYIWEPFSPLHRQGTLAIPWRHWFPYVCEENAAPYERAIERSLAFDYRAGAELRTVRSAKDVGRMGRDWYRWRRHRSRRAAPLYKDPIAVYSAEWLAGRFDMDVVCITRHPCAFAASIKRLNWAYTARFGDLLAQPLLMRDFLGRYADELREFSEREHDIVDQGALLWRVQTEAIVRHRERHGGDWTFVRLEDLSREPVDRFRALFDRVGLRWDDGVEAMVRSTSDASNPAEASRPDSVSRDSATHVTNWKRRLTEAEIARVRASCEPLWTQFYDERDW